eukprot:s962_g8.t1
MPPDDGETRSYREELFDMFLPVRGTDPALRRRHTKQRFVLRRLLNGRLQDEEVQHWCPWGCCPSPAFTVRAMSCFLTWALVPVKLPKFPRSRWTKWDVSLRWAGLLCGCHGLFRVLMLTYLGGPRTSVPEEVPVEELGPDCDWDQLLDDAQRVQTAASVQGRAPADADEDMPDDGAAEEAGSEEDAPAGKAAQEFDWAAWFRDKRSKARSWVMSQPFSRLTVMTEVATVLLTLMASFLLHGGSSWEKRQEARSARGEPRTYPVLEAARGHQVSACMDSLNALLGKAPKVLRPVHLTPSLRCFRFRILACALCSIHSLIRLPRKGFPVRLFAAMDAENVKDVLAAPSCMWDSLAKKDTPDKLQSAEARALLCALASTISLDISQIEARHASNREVTLLNSKGWLASLTTLAATYICWTVARMMFALEEVAKVCRSTFRGPAQGSQQRKRVREPPRRRGGGGPWRCFLHERCKGVRFTVESLSRLAEEYRNLSPLEKQRFSFSYMATVRGQLLGTCWTMALWLPPAQQSKFAEHWSTLANSLRKLRTGDQHDLTEEEVKALLEAQASCAEEPLVSALSRHEQVSSGFVKTGRDVQGMRPFRWVPPEHTVENQQNNLVAILKQHDEDEEANIPQTRIDKANAAAVKLLLEIKKPKVSKLSWARSARSCAKSLEDLLVVGYDSETAVMRELLNAKKLWNTVTSNPARAANAELLQHPFGKCWEGWILAQVVDLRNSWRGWCPGEASQEKSSASGARVGNPFDGTDDDGFVNHDVTHKYKLVEVRTRRYANSHSTQNSGTAWQATALDQTVDLDIENCSFTLLLQILDKLKPKHECWSTVRQALYLCAAERKKVTGEKLKLPLNGSEHLFFNFLPVGSCRNLERDSLAWPALVHKKDKPDVSVLTCFWNIAEDLSVESWIRKPELLQSKHMSLHFDGISVDRDITQPDKRSFLQKLQRRDFQGHWPGRNQSSVQKVFVQREIEEPAEAPAAVMDELLAHLEESLVQVALSQSHAVLLRRAELHALTLLGAGRDFLLRSLRGSTGRQRLESLFGGDCARISRLRAVLESLPLSAGRTADARLKGCSDACDAVESVLRDLGLQETLRSAQQQKKAALQETLEQKRLEEEALRKQRREEARSLWRLQQEERLALERALEGQHEVETVPSIEGNQGAEALKPDFAARDPSMLNWFLDYAEGILCDVLCFLDGISLTRFEMAGRWPLRLYSTSLPGVWRFVHLCSLGGRPPRTLSRAPQPRGRGRSGAWKQYWLGRRLLLRESDGAQRQIAFEQARLLLTANAHAVVQPMKPNPRLLRRIIAYCLPPGFAQDPRFGPMEERWCTHLMVGAESMVTHANGVQTNYEQFYMSWSVCFSAAQGLPRLFLASARYSEQETWEVDLADCRLPPRAPMAWAAAAQEIHELRAAGRDVSAGLCDARELCSVRFQGPQWQIQSAQLAPAADWGLLHKEVFGAALGSSPAWSRQLCSAAPGAHVPKSVCAGAGEVGARTERAAALAGAQRTWLRGSGASEGSALGLLLWPGGSVLRPGTSRSCWSSSRRRSRATQSSSTPRSSSTGTMMPASTLTRTTAGRAGSWRERAATTPSC